jgi:uncharacterized protein (TIGR02145 family)
MSRIVLAFLALLACAALSAQSTCEIPSLYEPFLCGNQLEYDGYYYETAEIGGQCWFAENVRTTTYSNGDTISSPIFESDWSNAFQTSTGSTVVYGFDSPYPWYGQMDCATIWNNDSIVNGINYCDPAVNLNLYGRLYNYYAVLDERGICPSGWHISSQSEYDELLDFLDDLALNWTSLMSTDGWIFGDVHSDGNYSDEFGFGAMPGGVKSDGGTHDFIGAGGWGVWWTSFSDSLPNARHIMPSYQSPSYLFTSVNFPFGYGASIRCIKDQ